MLRVLDLHSGNMYGGIEVFLRTLAGLAPGAGMHIEFALTHEGRLADELRADGRTVHMLGALRLRNPLTVRRGQRALRSCLARGGFDVAVLNNEWTMASLGRTVNASGVPLAYHLNNLCDPRHWLWRLSTLARPDGIICSSDYIATSVDRLHPRTPRVVVRFPVLSKPTAADARRTLRAGLGASDDTTVLFQASRMEAWKGHALFVEGLGRMRRDVKWAAWIAGGAQRDSERAYEASLKERVRELGLEGRVSFLGMRSDVPALMTAADVFCQPNVTPEPYGIVFIEALEAGLPIVATAFGGALEIVDSTCGVLVPPGDAPALGAALERLVMNPDERRALGRAAPARGRALCDPSTQAARYAEALGEIARRSSERRKS